MGQNQENKKELAQRQINYEKEMNELKEREKIRLDEHFKIKNEIGKDKKQVVKMKAHENRYKQDKGVKNIIEELCNSLVDTNEAKNNQQIIKCIQKKNSNLLNIIKFKEQNSNNVKLFLEILQVRILF